MPRCSTASCHGGGGGDADACGGDASDSALAGGNGTRQFCALQPGGQSKLSQMEEGGARGGVLPSMSAS